MQGPISYFDWVVVLERFGNGDDSALEEMNTGSFVLDSGTAQRFYSSVEEVYKKRKKSWLDKFQRSFHVQNLRIHDDFGTVLQNGKQNLLPLVRFSSSKGLPEDLRIVLKKDLEDFVAEIRKSLKENVSKISTGRDKLLLILNRFELPLAQPQDMDPKKSNERKDNNSKPPSGRKIIF